MSATAEAPAVPRVSGWRKALGKARSNPTTLVGAVICLVILAAAILAPWIAPHDPAEQDIISRLAPPGGDYPLGTDQFGRDILSRLLWGARISLTVSLTGTGFFEVSLIPTTLELTTLGAKGVGEQVNLEVDITAKYVEKLLQAGGRA